MRKLFSIIFLTLIVWGVASCDSHIIFDRYEHTPIAGWEKNDTLFFNIPSVTEAGTYRQELGLRITGTYPFMSLRLVVEQEIWPNKRIVRDTLDCSLINEKGTPKGQGISYFQYNMPVNNLTLQEGDSLHICVKHDMKREILPGISDIGIKMARQ
jgi:gliding motility-associated lipoprotein GldH